ncbi:hypothetical protein ABZ835_37640 [Streptomyces sp. NPDC047461]|uniref:hypothetical protein n=1 Tax=Streptomyces sp. NPDC047461 TaxID=3155619 RepID=UPI0033C72E39
MLDTKGTPVSVVIAGDRAHSFALPRDVSVMPPKVLKALEKVQAAAKAEQEASGKNANNFVAMREANDKVRDALNELYDTAAAGSTAARQQYREAFEYGVRRYQRAIEDAQAALQDVVTASLLYDQAANGCAVGLSGLNGVKPAMGAQYIYAALETLPTVPALEEA